MAKIELYPAELEAILTLADQTAELIASFVKKTVLIRHYDTTGESFVGYTGTLETASVAINKHNTTYPITIWIQFEVSGDRAFSFEINKESKLSIREVSNLSDISDS